MTVRPLPTLVASLALLGLSAGPPAWSPGWSPGWSAVAWAGEPQCGAHEHVLTEKDEDEGSTVKRCVCDEGWDADGPGKPCRAPGASPASPPQGGGGKAGGKAPRRPGGKAKRAPRSP